jgi:hypothetical protein
VKILGNDLIGVTEEIKAEYDMQRLVSERGCRHILDVFGNGIRRRAHNPQIGYLYMEYAPFGSLDNLLEGLIADPEYVKVDFPLDFLCTLHQNVLTGC